MGSSKSSIYFHGFSIHHPATRGFPHLWKPPQIWSWHPRRHSAAISVTSFFCRCWSTWTPSRSSRQGFWHGKGRFLAGCLLDMEKTTALDNYPVVRSGAIWSYLEFPNHRIENADCYFWRSFSVCIRRIREQDYFVRLGCWYFSNELITPLAWLSPQHSA